MYHNNVTVTMYHNNVTETMYQNNVTRKKQTKKIGKGTTNERQDLFS